MTAKKLLILHNIDYPNHTEQWLWDNDEKCVLFFSACSNNYPVHTQGKMTLPEALRQFCLLTSGVERWKVSHEYEAWHKLVEEYQPNNIQT